MNLHEFARRSGFARRMPKIELHVHLEDSTRPATLLQLARRNSVILPAPNNQIYP